MDCTYFSIDELVCEDVYNKFGKDAFKFFDPKLLITLDTLRDRIGRPIFINNWMVHGKFSQRGLRCIRCEIVQDKIMSGELYMSAHCLGKGADCEVQGMLAEETRQWIIKNAKWWPYSIRLEADVNWVHIDVMANSDEKVTLFKA
jgi:hypothetical protein